MELNICPACESFIKSDWTNCRTCDLQLRSTAAEIPIPISVGAAPSIEDSHENAEEDYLWPEAETLPETTWDAPDSDEPTEIDEPALSDPPADAEPETSEEPLEPQPVPALAPSWQFRAPEAEEPATGPMPALSPDWTPLAAAPENDTTPDSDALVTEVADPFDAPVSDAASASDASATLSNIEDHQEQVLDHHHDKDEWSNEQFLQPIELTFQRFSLASPTTQTVSELRAATEKVEPISRRWIFALSIGGAIIVGLGLVIFGVLGLMGTTSPTSHNKDKLVSLPSSSSLPHKTSTTIALATASKWVSYSNPQFSIEFPGQPTQTSANSTDHKTIWEAPVVETDGTHSSAFVTTQNAPANATADSTLNGLVNSDAQALGANIKSRSIVTQDARRQISAHMTTANMTYDLTAFIQNNTIYTVMVASNNPNGDPELFGHLTSTFQPTLN